jgi:IPT/TIG domain
MKIKHALICGTLAAAIGLPLAMPNAANAARIWGPAVYSVSPNSGPTSGGTTVTVTGDDLTMATAVTFGGVPASFTIVSNTEIIAVSPAESAGTVVVKAIDPPNPGLGGANFTYS